MKRRFKFIICSPITFSLFLLLLTSGCGNNPITIDTCVSKEIIKSSEKILPFKTEGFGMNNIGYYDFSSIDLSQYNDFDINYRTSTTCDEDISVYNFSSKSWEQIANYPPQLTPCGGAITEQYHIFSLSEVNNYNFYVDEEKIMQIKGARAQFESGGPYPFGVRAILYQCIE